MIFTSLTFLFFFVTVLTLCLVISNNKGKEYLLLFASFVFYGAWNPLFILLIIFCSSAGWLLGNRIYSATSEYARRFYLAISLVVSLGVLGYFKYASFLAENLAALTGIPIDVGDITLPVGISFFTFQTMSYTIDLYRGRVDRCRDFHKFMLFVAFFPQLVAGPIVRASEFLPQLQKDIKITFQNIVIGLQLFLGGAIQKSLFADNLSVLVDPVFSEPALYSTSTLWLAALAYAGQIFGDFAGYSLMAIGIARCFGFTLPENFRMPYLSLSLTEFWRRWHMTLSFWLRDYLYISLGGNRRGLGMTYVNQMTTMLLGGLWHGASWNFVLWGALQGAGLGVHKYWDSITGRWMIKELVAYKILAWFTTFLFVVLCWIPFRCDDFGTTIVYLERLFIDSDGVTWHHPQSMIILGAMVVWHLLFLKQVSLLMDFPTRSPERWWPSFVICMSLLLISLFVPLATSPFIYFQF